MPKAPKLSQGTSDAKVKQITDFFPRRPGSQGSGSGGTRKNAKHNAAKENTTPHVRNPHSKIQIDNAISSNSDASSVPQRAISPIPTKAVPQITSPMQPSTKRSRSQSIAAPQPAKQYKRRNILCESTLAEDAMDVDENSVVYVPAVTAVAAALADPSPISLVSSSDYKKTISPDSEVSLVPSSVSDENELDLTHVERKDTASVTEAVDHWRQEALPPSPVTSTSSPVEIRTQPQPNAQSCIDADWNMRTDPASNVTPSRRNVTATNTNASIPTPPATDGPEDILRSSPIKLLDEKAKTEQIIAEIRARASARSRPQEPSSPLSEVTSLDSSDDEDNGYDSLAVLGFKTDLRAKSPIKARSPVKSSRYNLRKAAPLVEAKPRPLFPSRRNASPSPPARLTPGQNPVDTLLEEKRVVSAKSSMTSADRDARLRELADMNLDDYDKDDDLNNLSLNGPTFGTDKNPFLDDDQNREVMDILEGDKIIEDEEERARQQGIVGVTLWSPQGLDATTDLEEALPSLAYQGSDLTLQTLVETVAHGDHHLTRLLIQSGVLEMADYREGGSEVIQFLISLALSYRQDDLDLSALRILSHILSNDTVVASVYLVDRILYILDAFGAQSSVLERMGWTGHNIQRQGASYLVRSEVIQRMVICIADVAKSEHLHRKEIPDIIAFLLLVGIELSASQESRLQVSRTIHMVCQSLGQGTSIEIDLECAIANKVLCLVQTYSVQNKLHAVSLIASGAGRTARIARSVAHAILTDKSTLLPSQYSALPSMLELLDMLNVTSPDAPQPLGKFEYHEATNYVDMACWTVLLAIAVTDVAAYMEVEEMTKQSREESIFETLHQTLKRIHDRIQDTRAAHLDRSQTKTILNNTLHRILYQSRAIGQYRRKRTGKIHNYMSRK